MFETIISKFPEAKIRYKTDFWYWRILPKKIRTSATILGNTIWLPSRDVDLFTLVRTYARFDLLKQIGRDRFYTYYLSPQLSSIICLFFFLAMFGLGFKAISILLLAMAFVALLPFPSDGRVLIEKEAVTAEIWAAIWLYGTVSLEHRKKLIDSLSGWGYYKMISREKAEILVDSIINEKHPWLEGNDVLQSVKESIDATTRIHTRRQ